MNLTPEQLRSNAAAMLAFAEGKPVESTTDAARFNWQPAKAPMWDCQTYYYRPAPEPATRRWSKPADVPFPFPLLRHQKDHDLELMINGVNTSGIFVRQSTVMEWISLYDYEYSTDRKQWHKCVVTEPNP